MRIVAVITPFETAQGRRPLTTVDAARASYAVDEFAEAVGRAAGLAVPVIEGGLGEVPADAWALLFDARGLAERPELARRVVLMNADRATVLRKLEEHQLAGAVEKHRYFLWQASRQQEDGGGLFARKALADKVGATLETPFQTEHYGLFKRSRYSDLPYLITGYLAAADAAGVG